MAKYGLILLLVIHLSNHVLPAYINYFPIVYKPYQGPVCNWKWPWWTAHGNLGTTVSVQWMRTHLPEVLNGSGRLVLLDTSWTANSTVNSYQSFYLQGHIPGAVHFDLNKCVRSTPTIPRNIPNIACFQDYIQTLGIYPNSRVIVYDRTDNAPSVRSWWILRLFGHERVSILDGGMEKWVNDGLEVTAQETVVYKRSNFGALMNHHLVREIRAMLNNLYTQEEQVADARGSRSYNGEMLANGTMIGGHIPGSVNTPFFSFFNDDRTFKSKDQLMRVFVNAGIDLHRPLVASCRTGMRACVVAAAAHILGKSTVPVYFGSWLEWSQLVGPDKKAYGPS